MEQMKSISNTLDELIDESNNMAEQIENKEIVVRNKKCDHAPIIANLKNELDQKQNEIYKTQNRID